MTGPSAIGSEKVIFSSIRSTPACTMLSTSRRLVSKCGCPSTMCVISRISCFCRRSFRYCSSTTITLRLLLNEGFPLWILKRVRHREDVFVAATGLIDQNDVVRRQRPHLFEGLGE